MPNPKPIPLIANNGIINSSGNSLKLTAIIPIMAEMTIKDKPMRLLFNTILHFL